MEQAGLETEYILCSGDPDSLDGLVLPQLGVAIVDGTAPHVVEAKYPAVVERYVDLGQSYDAAGLQDIREEIIGAMDGYPACYQRAYRCLGAAERLRESGLGEAGSPGPGHPGPGAAAQVRGTEGPGEAAFFGGGDPQGSVVSL